MAEKLLVEDSGMALDPSGVERHLSETHGGVIANHEHWPHIEHALELTQSTYDDPFKKARDTVDMSNAASYASYHTRETTKEEAARAHMREMTADIRRHMGLTGDYSGDVGAENIRELWGSLDGLKPYVCGEALDTESANLLAELLLDIDDRVSGDIGESLGFTKSAQMLELLPAEMMRQLYFTDRDGDGGFPQRIAKLKNRDLQLKILTSAYGDEKEARGYDEDPTAIRVERYFHGDEMSRRISLMPMMPRGSDRQSVAEYNDTVTQEARSILVDVGLPKELIDSYLVTSALRLKKDDKDVWLGAAGAISSHKALDQLQSMVDHTKALGAEVVTQLYEKMGVENLWMYTDVELDDMLQLMNEDESIIDYFKDGDVTVEFLDTHNDYNGAFTYAGSPYRKQSGRTLRFEMSHPASMYRRMIFLRKLGIKPSVFVYAAHGEPGRTDASEYTLTSFDADSSHAIPIHKTQFGKIVRDFMQPNRGIDSDPSYSGCIQVILNSCSGDVAFTYEDRSYLSTAEAIAKTIGDADARADVYAAPGVEYTLLEDGVVKFNVRDDPNDENSPRHLRMHRLRPERRGGFMGYPTKTVVHRVPVEGLRVGRSYAT